MVGQCVSISSSTTTEYLLYLKIGELFDGTNVEFISLPVSWMGQAVPGRQVGSLLQPFWTSVSATVVLGK